MKRKVKKKPLSLMHREIKQHELKQARGDVAVFDKLYEEYRINPEITKERLVIETIEQVLPNAEVYIMNDDGNTLKYFPIRPLEKEEAKADETNKGSENNG